MLKILVKKQLTEIFRSYFYDAKNNKARSKGATAAYLCFFAVLMIAVLGGIFASMAFSLCLPLSAAGADWLVAGSSLFHAMDPAAVVNVLHSK